MTWLRSIGLESQSSRDNDEMDINKPVEQMQQMQRATVPLSNEWFAELDESLDTITNTFEELRLSQPAPEDDPYIKDTEQGLADIQNELIDCLASLQNAKRNLRKSTGDCDDNEDSDVESPEWDRQRGRYRSIPFFAQTPRLSTRPSNSRTRATGRSGMSPGEEVMKHVFRWWQPCGPGCVRTGARLDGPRMIEID